MTLHYTFGFTGMAGGFVLLKAVGLLRMSFENFKVTENEGVMEPVIPFDRFGLDNEKGAEAPSPTVRADMFDYTKQLEFHKQEVAGAEKHGMPQAQVDYHLGKIAVLEKCPGPPPKFEQHQLDCKPEDCSCGK